MGLPCVPGMPGQVKPPRLPPAQPGMPEPSMLGIDPSILGGGPPPMPFDPVVLEKQRMMAFDTGEKMTPADLFVVRQSEVLRKYYEMMLGQVAAMGGSTEAGLQPEMDSCDYSQILSESRRQPAHIGVDPHILGISE